MIVMIEMVMRLLVLQELRTASLARVVCDCMDDVDKLQPFLFLQPDTIANIRTRWGNIIVRSNNDLSPYPSCRGEGIPSPDLEQWREDPGLRPQQFSASHLHPKLRWHILTYS